MLNFPRLTKQQRKRKMKNEKRKRTHSQMSKKIIDYCQSSNPNQLVMYVSMAIILDITNSGILFSCLKKIKIKKKIKNQTHEIELMVVFSFLVSCESQTPTPKYKSRQIKRTSHILSYLNWFLSNCDIFFLLQFR